jgi:hypothetical protein
MATSARTFWVFVSSTFTDLEAEQNALQPDTFKKLRSHCERYGRRFQAIGLRWALNPECSK